MKEIERMYREIKMIEHRCLYVLFFLFGALTASIVSLIFI